MRDREVEAVGGSGRDDLLVADGPVVGRTVEDHAPGGAGRGRGGVGDVREGGGMDQDDAAGVGQAVLHLGGGQPGVERHEHRPEQTGGEQHFEIGGVVRRQQRDAVPGADTLGAQGVGEPGDPLVEFAVGDAGAAEGERDRVGGLPGASARPRTGTLVEHGISSMPGNFRMFWIEAATAG